MRTENIKLVVPAPFERARLTHILQSDTKNIPFDIKRNENLFKKKNLGLKIEQKGH